MRGPYQNNGATPWFAKIMLGTPGQELKIALDTGSDFTWATSTLCSKDDCQHQGKSQFNPSTSSTFEWITRADRTEGFGPWGDMIVETGRDTIGLTTGCSLRSSFYLAKHYAGKQFEELDWDGGIGLPASSNNREPLVLAELMKHGYIDPELPYISFSSAAAVGACRLGGVDPSSFHPESGLFLPWTMFPAASYIWSSALDECRVNGKLVASNVFFCLDSGSSEFKGDVSIMEKTLDWVGAAEPEVRLRVSGGEILIPSSVYRVEAAGGKAQFNPHGLGSKGLRDLVLVGSVLMDHLYTVYEYDVTQTDAGYQLEPRGMWVFNKVGGRELVKPRNRPPALGRKPVRRGG